MASTTRPPVTPGPGRETPSTRTSLRSARRASKSVPSVVSPPVAQAAPEPVPVAKSLISHSLNLTWRAAAVAVVLVILIGSYLQSFIVYVNQQRQITATQQANAATRADIDSMRDEITRWQDPGYVKAQARERLGWAVPGDTAFIVVGPDGQPVASGATITQTGALPAGEHPTAWFDQLLGSVQTADDPSPKTPG